MQSCWGPKEQDAVPGDPTPAQCGVVGVHTPNIRPNSSLGEGMGTRAASQLKQGRGLGSMGGGGVAALMDIDDG